MLSLQRDVRPLDATRDLADVRAAVRVGGLVLDHLGLRVEPGSFLEHAHALVTAERQAEE
jgi:hypothetical protein